MVDELPFVEMTILSHITKIDSFDIDPVLLVIKLRLFVFDIRWFPSNLDYLDTICRFFLIYHKSMDLPWVASQQPRQRRRPVTCI